MKKILIVGAGEYQLPGIIEAKKQGCYVLATDGDPKAIGRYYADDFYHIDIKDKEEHLVLAREKEIRGVAFIAAEAAVETVAYVSEKMELVGNSYETARRAHDKSVYYPYLKNKGILVPQTFVHEGLNTDFEIKTEEAILKPSKGSGSRLVVKVKKNDIPFHLQKMHGQINYGECMIIQEYISGKEITVDAFVYDQMVYVLAISEEKCDEKISASVSSQLDFPPVWLKDKDREKIQKICTKLMKEMDIVFGPIHAEFIMDANENLYLIDFALRGGGFHLFTEIIQRTSHVDVLHHYISAVMGKTIKMCQPEKYDPVIMKFLYADQAGILKEIKGQYLAGQRENYILEFLKKPGDCVQKPLSGRDRLAYMILWDETPDQIETAMHDIESAIEFDIVPYGGVQ